MRNKKIKISALLFLCFGLTELQAQSTMYVNEQNGQQTLYTISSIRKLTFPSHSMQVFMSVGSTTYTLSDIRNLIFEDLITNVTPVDIEKNLIANLYPNPVIDQLQISYKSLKTDRVQLEISDLQGRVLQQQIIISEQGTNHIIIPVSQLSQGLYMCCLKSDDNIEIIKFLKK